MMRRLRAALRRLFGLFRRDARAREFAAELEANLQMHIDDNLRRGMTPEEARRQAHVALGGVQQASENYREQAGFPGVERLGQDVRYAVRVLRKNPGFTLVALLTLGLGIGANTAIFSLVSALLLKPLPYDRAERLVSLAHTPPQDMFPGTKTFAVSPANFLDWRASSHAFEAMAAYSGTSVNWTDGSRPESVNAGVVEPELFDVLHTRPALGRTFALDEKTPGKEKVAILSQRFWRTRLGGDKAAVGRTIRLNGDTYQVVGVMPTAFAFPGWADLWLPLAWSPEDKQVRGIHDYRTVARLKDGVTLAQAQSEMDAIARGLAETYPADDKGWGAVVLPLRDDLVGDVRPALLVLFVAVSLVLLIACANVANLVLSRTLARRREMAVRAALGAARGRIARQILVENLVLALCGGMLGLGLAYVAVDALIALLGDNLPRAAEVGVDGWALLFTVAVSVATGLLAGLVPAVRLTKVDLSDALKQGIGKTASDTAGRRTRGALVVVEVAVSLVLLVAAGLMVRTLSKLRDVDSGFDVRDAVSMTVSISDRKYPTPGQQIEVYDRMLERVRALPGIQAAGAVSGLPGMGGSTQPVAVEGEPVVPMSEQPEFAMRVITPGYLQAMRIPVRRGRDLDAQDAAERTPVVLVSEAFARRFWPEGDPIGRRLTLSFFPGVVREVVGVVGEVKQKGPAMLEPTPTVYVPLAQMHHTYLSFVVRPKATSASLVKEVIAAVQQIDPEQPVTDVLTLRALLDVSVIERRATMLLLAAFAAFAVVLASIGLYGVLAYGVRQRVQEIGIRIALGARRADVLWMILGQGLRLTVVGLAVGTAGALAVTRLLSELLFGVPPSDPITFVSVAALLCGIAAVACWPPARLALRVDPMVALRNE
jgi:predicted permease